MGAARPGSHRWFSSRETYHRGHSDLQGPAVLVKPEKNKPSGRYVSSSSFFLFVHDWCWHYSQIKGGGGLMESRRWRAGGGGGCSLEN